MAERSGGEDAGQPTRPVLNLTNQIPPSSMWHYDARRKAWSTHMLGYALEIAGGNSWYFYTIRNRDMVITMSSRITTQREAMEQAIAYVRGLRVRR